MEIKTNVVSKFLLLWVVGMLLSVQAFAQGFTVKGVVKDNTGMGVIWCQYSGERNNERNHYGF